jgi:2-keto-4-pentenoate hydratase
MQLSTLGLSFSMTTSFDPQRFAAELLDARRMMSPIVPGAGATPPRSHDEAYAVQAAVMAHLGPVGAFKTGRKAPTDTQIMAPIPASGVRPTPATFSAEEMRLVGVELEIAFRLDGYLPAIGSSDFKAKLRDAVSVLAVIEVVDCRLADPYGDDVFAKLADNQFNQGLVLGPAQPIGPDMTFSDAEVDFRAENELLGSGWREVPGGDAFDTFADFVALVGDHCGGLQRGHIVTTGALTGLHFVERGVDVVGRIAGLGEVKVSFPA